MRAGGDLRANAATTQRIGLRSGIRQASAAANPGAALKRPSRLRKKGPAAAAGPTPSKSYGFFATFGSLRVSLKGAVRRRTARAARFMAEAPAKPASIRIDGRCVSVKSRCDKCRQRIGYIWSLKSGRARFSITRAIR